MQDIAALLQEIMKPILADFAGELERVKAEQQAAEETHNAYLQEYGDFVGNALYYEQIKGE